MNGQAHPKPSFPWKKCLAGVSVAVVVLLLLAWLALPGIVQSQAQKYIQEKTGHRLNMARPEINPLALKVRLSALELHDPDDKALLAFDELVVDMSWASLPKRAMILDEIRLAGARLVVTQSGDQRLNWSTILDALSGPKETSSPAALPRLDIGRLEVSDAQVDFADRRTADGFASRIAPIDLTLTDLTTISNEHGQASLSAHLTDGAQISLSGEASLAPLAVEGEFSIKELALATIRTYVKEALPAPPGGKATLTTHYRVENNGKTLGVVLSNMALTLEQLRVPLTASAESFIATEQVAMTGARFDITTQELAVETLTFNDTVLHLPGIKQAPRLGKLTVADVKVDLANHDASVAGVTLENGDIRATRDAKGNVDLAQAVQTLKARPIAVTNAANSAAKAAVAAPSGTASGANPVPTPVAANEKPARPWRYQIKALTLDGWALALKDEATNPPAELGLNRLNIALDGLSNDMSRPVPVRVAAQVGETGRLAISGNLSPNVPSAELKVALTDFPLSALRPYIEHYTHLTPAKGRFGTEGVMRYGIKGNPGPSYQGGFSIADLQMDVTSTREPVLTWRRFDTKSLRASDTRMDIGELNLVGLDSRLIIEKDKTVNVSRIMKKPGDTAGASGTTANAVSSDSAPPNAPGNAAKSAESPTPQAASGAMAPGAASQQVQPPAFQVNIASLRLSDCELDFADRSLILPFETRIHNLAGRINGLSNRPGRRGQLDLEGEVDEFGLARAAGEIDLFNPTGYTDIAVSFRNVDMPRLSPYTATAAGRRIDSGKLSLELRYSIKDRQLQATNQVIIDRLVLGERVDSPTAVDLPLTLAIALLEDSDGRIDLGLPIAGNLDDPQFSYGHIIWKAITNVLTKIVTSPFRAIGALFGGDDALEAVVFDPGSAKLAPPEREKLVRVSSAIAKRPKLTLSLRGLYAPEDRTALQDEQLRRSLLAALGDSVDRDIEPGPVALDNPKVQSELESLYSKRKGSNELAAIKEGFRLANPGQLEESPTRKLMSRLTGLMQEKKTLSEAETAQLAGKNFWAVLYERVRATEPIGDERLTALATGRATYAFDQLKRLGVAPERMHIEPPKSGQAGDHGIPIELTPVPAP